ncbi:hypothetical protein [Pseudomonas sp. 'CRE Jenny 4']|nr:hypothetical protein [Pseudomonas sp. 'CRE Jenny 4']
MNNFLYWFMFWKEAKSLHQAAFQGVIGGIVFSLVVFSPLWIVLLELHHD